MRCGSSRFSKVLNVGLVIVVVLLNLICSVLSSASTHSTSSSSDINTASHNHTDNVNIDDQLLPSSESEPINPTLQPTATITTKVRKEGRKRQQHHKQRQNVNGILARRHEKTSLGNVTSHSSYFNSSFWGEKSIVTPTIPTAKAENDKTFHEETVDNVSEGKEPFINEEKKQKKTKVDTRPNIILIITDDQDVELGSMDFMPNTLKVFRNEGIEFRHGYVTTPMCCPSRSSLLTGLYVHNHMVYTNNDNCSSITWRSKYEKKTFNYYLHSSGYHTSYIGKYLNKYDGSHQPAGWDEWLGLLMNSRFYNYTVNRNGKKVRYGNNYQTDYYPDVITHDTLDFLDRMSPPKKPISEGTDDTNNSRKPFLLVVSYPSPHGPEDAHPQYSELFFNATPHHTPSYNYAPNVDKQWILRVTGRMTSQLKNFTNLLMTKRLQSLQSVDASVKSVFKKLEDSGLINSTYVFYTSDHGYHVGQFGLVKGKSMPYEFDIRVPFFLSTPKKLFNRSVMIQEPVLNIDLAPTFIDLAGLPVPSHMDGRSLLPLINKYIDGDKNKSQNVNLSWSSTFIVESSGRREFPSPFSNGRSSKQPVATQVSHMDNQQSNKNSRFQNMCASHPYPCLPNQKKYCQVDHNNQVRLRKCRLHFDYQSAHGNNNEEEQEEFNFRRRGSGAWNENSSKCRCTGRRRNSRRVKGRFHRDVGFDWEEERLKIDGEIDELKLRINGLREKRRNMRIKWIDGLKAKSTAKKQNADEDDNDFDISGSNLTATIGAPRKNVKGRRLHHVFKNCEEYSSDCDKVLFSNNNNKNNRNTHNKNRMSSTFVVTANTEVDETDKGSDQHSDETIHHSEEDDGDGDAEKVDGNNDDDDDEDEDDVVGEEEEQKVLKPFYDHHNTSVAVKEQNHNNHRYHSRGRVNKNQENDGTRPHRAFRKGNGSSRHRNGHKLLLLPRGSTEEVDCNCRRRDGGNDNKLLKFIEREDRKRRKLKSKIRKKERFLNRIDDPQERILAETCGQEEKMNCFWHDNDHWRTKPLWTGGSFCFCMNSNNNTYTCLRSVNATHDYLYCHFVTGFKMYFDLLQDPYELHNLIGSLPVEQEEWMLKRLFVLKNCHGRNCWSDEELLNANIELEQPDVADGLLQSTMWDQVFGRWTGNKKKSQKRKKKPKSST